MFEVLKEAVEIVTQFKQGTPKRQEITFCPKCKNTGILMKSKFTKNSTTVWNESCDCGHYLQSSYNSEVL